MKKLAYLFLTLPLLLQSCFVVGAAAGAAAIVIIYDHRPVNVTMEDTRMENDISRKIHAIPNVRNESHIDVTVFNRVVLLTGQTPKAAWRDQIEAIAKSQPNVQKVYDEITIEGPTSSLTRASDGWITAKIKSEMLTTAELKTNNSSIKVITENGTVYLMGEVTEAQAETTVDIARHVSGVRRVIKMFQYKS